MLLDLYEPARFFRRALRSLECWEPHPAQHVPRPPNWYRLRIGFASLWHQGLRSNYRRDNWRFLAIVLRRWRGDPVRMWQATVMLLSAHHFVHYARETAEELAGAAAAAPPRAVPVARAARDVPSSA